ncbi:UDP-glucose dehydrogenase family protein [Novacetimonas pomaceti]|uniref:UDP-glucose 6-dehydrogenase n=1 Tax=Novacetimonas pomaceti TaxID=2021998 RepID=A0A318QCE2_9PROT|nr:UDP-glucose/GDP-mannose dehydrogenase family protein [Novacetimonas pomaceti]MBV1833132.1 UDP-glucose/GDP-mannose dehydrogenase family protein [Novacetimonas pomaceti]PYD48266.1 UDP-glucose 6-dehydrogenase [Novacetimonas pomaceti]PYD74912.1 UDP-glucose 6-dehydrogenase [Novacetimonas pomaceti]
MKIAVIGAGYVGLVSGACLADFGHEVCCIDRDPRRIENLRAGRMPIYEPGLAELTAANVSAGRLFFEQDLATGIRDAEVIFIAVGTPSRPEDGHADLTFVYDVTREIAAHLKGYAVIVTKSTVPVGTSDEVERIVRSLRPEIEFSVASNPEFLREGAAIGDFKIPDRIVVGVEDDRARAVMAAVYRPLFLNQAPMLFTDRRSSELTKYAANAFLATKITFINEMADICEKTGANVQDVARGMGLDKRIGPKFLHAGPGFGGSCFPKDVRALIKTGQDFDVPSRIVEAVADVNERRKRRMGRRIIAACGGDIRDRVIAVLGLTFKPRTDDMREAPSIAIIQTLHDAGARVHAFDPAGMEQAREVLGDVTYFRDPYQAVAGADAVAIVTEWESLRALDLKKMHGLMRRSILVDLRNIYVPEQAVAAGFTYLSVGRGDLEA